MMCDLCTYFVLCGSNGSGCSVGRTRLLMRATLILIDKMPVLAIII